jgi:hypothetical protein
MTNFKIHAFSLCLILTFQLNAQTENNKTNLPDFNKILITGRAEINIIYDSITGIDIREVSGLTDKDYKWGVKKGVLTIKCNNDNKSKLRIWLYFKNIDEIKAYLGADIFVDSIIISDKLNIDINTGAKVRINAETKETTAKVKGGGLLVLNGKSDKAYFEASTGSNIDALNFTVEIARVFATTGGLIKVNATKFLNATVSIGGNVNYSGKPEIINTKQKIGGNIIQIE